MDTKLKDKKIRLSLIVFLMSVCIAFAIGSAITIRTAKIDKKRNLDTKNNCFENVYNNVQDLMLYTDGLNGELREDSIKYEANRLREEDSIHDDNYQSDINDQLLREEYVRNKFESYVHDLLIELELRKNIEFYFEMDEGRKPFTNVDNMSKDEFEEDTLNNYDEYIIIKPNGQLKTSSGLKEVGSYLLSSSSGSYVLTHNNYDVIFRIAQPLQEGDLIYENIMSERKNSAVTYISIVILMFSCIGLLYCIIKIRKNDFKVNVERGIIKLLGRISIEAKLLALGLAYIYWLEVKRSCIMYSMFEDLIPVIVVLLIIFFAVLDCFRIRYVYGGLKIKSIISTESIINKLKVIFVRGGIVLDLLFLLANVTIWYVSLLTFTFVERDLSLRLGNSPADGMFATFCTILIDGMIIRKLSSIKDIVKGIKEISQGNYNFNVDVKGPKIFREVVKDLDNIQNGLKESVDKVVKSERMKSELITNVSHDLKTPLTSIINYVDLLNQENITEEQRKKYLGILKDKSNRLKALIEDLFEVSKASSGSMELDMQDLDPVSLLRQTLGEFEDKIENSNLKIIKKLPEEKLMIYADGRKTFRIFQNLLSNIFKYSMEGSRVYIEVSDSGKYVEVIFKNTSKEELNFTEEEILQRFKRGDASRTTDGSGLGLAIAKSLTEVQEGIFDIKIDGDLFKAIVKMKKEK